MGLLFQELRSSPSLAAPRYGLCWHQADCENCQTDYGVLPHLVERKDASSAARACRWGIPFALPRTKADPDPGFVLPCPRVHSAACPFCSRLAASRSSGSSTSAASRPDAFGANRQAALSGTRQVATESRQQVGLVSAPTDLGPAHPDHCRKAPSGI